MTVSPSTASGTSARDRRLPAAAAATTVVGTRPRPDLGGLDAGRPPLHEPGLAELIRAGLASGRLSFTRRPRGAAARPTSCGSRFDTPVDDDDEADVGVVRAQLEPLAAASAGRRPRARLLAGAGRLHRARLAARLARAGGPASSPYSPENLRLGKAHRGLPTARPHRRRRSRRRRDRARLEQLFAPFTAAIDVDVASSRRR